jgi:hypothetical protein
MSEEDSRRNIHLMCEQFRQTNLIKFDIPSLQRLVKTACKQDINIPKADIQTLRSIFQYTCDTLELEEMKEALSCLQSSEKISEVFFKHVSTLQDNMLKDVCKDMIYGFSMMNKMKTKKFSNWRMHSKEAIGVESQFAKVYSVCASEEKEQCLYVVKATIINEFYTLQHALNEVQMQYECNQIGLAPAILDAFYSTSCFNKKKNKVVFMVMEKKGFTIKELFTRLLPLAWWEEEINKKLAYVVYRAGLALLDKANKNGYFHMDPHLGNFMFELPRSTMRILRGMACDPKKYSAVFKAFCESDEEQIHRNLGLDSLMLIDFGMTNREGPEAIEKYKGSFSKLNKLKPTKEYTKDCEEYV